MAASETLRTVIDAGNASRRLDELTTARVILKIAEQVHAAQQKAGAGKAIGPLTPSSITIEPAGVVKLGLAEPNAFAYAAPEQLGASEGDRRSDVWSLGVVMWEALTHTALFEGGDDDAIKAAVRQQTIDPPATLNANIPSELSAICMRALSRNPADRYQSAKVMAAELEAVLDDAGYGDNDDKIRELMTTLGQPKREARISVAPMTVTPGQGVAPPPEMLKPPPGPSNQTAPGMVIPRGDLPPPGMLKPPQGPANQTAPGMVIPRGDDPPPRAGTQPPITVGTRAASGTQPPKPSILDREPTEPPAAMLAASAGSLGADSQKNFITEPTLAPPEMQMKPEPPAASAVGLAATPLSPTSFIKDKPASAGASLASALANAATPKADPAKPDLGAALANAGTAPKPQDRSAFRTLQSAGVPIPQTPMAPVLPKITSAATALGFSSGAPELPKVAQPIPSLEQAGAYRAKIDQVAAESAAKAAKPVVPASVSAAVTIETPLVKKLDPTPAPRKRAPTGNPDPSSVVALPAFGGRAGRESQEVLGGWGWGTDSHPAIKTYDGGDDEEHPPATNKKTLIYVFGGLLGVAAIVVIVAFAFGGSSSPAKEKAKEVATAGSGSASAIAYGSGVEYGKATGDPAGGSGIGSAGSVGSADLVGSAGSASESGPGPGSGSGSADGVSSAGSPVATTMTGSAAMAGSATTAVNTNIPPVAKTPDKTPDKVAAKTPDKVAVKAPDKVAVKTPDKTPDKVAVKTPPVPPVPVVKDKDKHPVVAPPHPHAVVAEGPTPTAKADAETAYRQGLQLFARGDSSGALASLRVSLASNPGYAPTWRGLGLVFEKMGEKDQAKAAFKRYLQLAPGASDADQIRNRMERLGS